MKKNEEEFSYEFPSLTCFFMNPYSTEKTCCFIRNLFVLINHNDEGAFWLKQASGEQLIVFPSNRWTTLYHYNFKGSTPEGYLCYHSILMLLVLICPILFDCFTFPFSYPICSLFIFFFNRFRSIFEKKGFNWWRVRMGRAGLVSGAGVLLKKVIWIPHSYYDIHHNCSQVQSNSYSCQTSLPNLG